MRLLYQVGRPGENVLAPVSENDQVLFLLKPQANSLFSTSLIAPDFDSRVCIVLDDRLGPADALAAAKIRDSAFLVAPLGGHVPEGCFFALAERVPLQPKPPALESGFVVDEILFEPGVQGFQVSWPITTAVIEEDKGR